MSQFAGVRNFDEAKQMAAYLVKKYKKGVQAAGFSNSKLAAEAILRQELVTDDDAPAAPVSAPAAHASAPAAARQMQAEGTGDVPQILVNQVAAHLKGLSEEEKDALASWESMASRPGVGATSGKFERHESKNEGKLHEENQYLKKQIELLNSKLYGAQDTLPQQPSQPPQQAAQPHSQQAVQMSHPQQQKQQMQQSIQPPKDDEVPGLETTLQGLQRRQEVEKYLLAKGGPLDEVSTVDDEVFEREKSKPAVGQPASSQSADKEQKRDELRKAIDDLLKPGPIPAPLNVPAPTVPPAGVMQPLSVPSPVTVIPTALPAIPTPTYPPMTDTKAYFWDAYNKELNKAFQSPGQHPAGMASPLANQASVMSFMSSPKASTRKQGVIMSPPITPSRPVY